MEHKLSKSIGRVHVQMNGVERLAEASQASSSFVFLLCRTPLRGRGRKHVRLELFLKLGKKDFKSLFN